MMVVMMAMVMVMMVMMVTMVMMCGTMTTYFLSASLPQEEEERRSFCLSLLPCSLSYGFLRLAPFFFVALLLLFLVPAFPADPFFGRPHRRTSLPLQRQNPPPLQM
jgi:flagellar biosynthesis protein FlhB